MPTLYLDDQHSSIRISGQEFVITTGDQERERIPFAWVERIVIAGNVQISTQALTSLLKESIPVCFMSTKGNYRGCLQTPTHKHAALRIAQFERFRDPVFRRKQASSFIEAKVKNCRTALLKHRRAHHDFHCDMELEGMNCELNKLKDTPSIEGLMGHEGVAAHWYFMAFGNMVRKEFSFKTRSRRPPKDPVNAMLSLGYTLLYNEFVTATEAIGMDPNIGFLHSVDYGRASLASDMVEEFRWLIDGLVLGLVNKSIVQPDDFISQADGSFKMADPARKKFYEHYEQRMRDEAAYRDKRLSYRRIFFHQAEHLARVIQNEEEQYHPHLIQ
jgi:CRISPR-associated protein Cas1